eukprot:c49347_g1_i1.p3 GENE.c49347_g1_i1~~c49347_g1_i1.p3  ORF type:complete len:124 (+),score=21.96 c49347_g1_i1:33-374(+)
MSGSSLENGSALALYSYLFGAVTIAGGLMGKVKKGSNASLIAGTVFGGSIIAAAAMQPSKIATGATVLVSGALAYRFVPAALNNGFGSMPAGPMALLAVSSVAVGLLTLLKQK